MNRGFTLIEMLAVISILGILIVTVIFSSNKLINASKNKYYHTEEKLMIIAAKDYFSDYRSYLPKEINTKTRVLLSALVTEEYIETIKGTNNLECNLTKSYVEVDKISSDEFVYKAHLDCAASGYTTKD